MGLSLVLLAATIASGAVSVAGTLEQRKAVKAQAKTNARIERRNSVQKQLDLETNKTIEAANRQETVMEAGFQRRQIIKQARRERASTTAQLGRQGIAFGSPSLDAVLQNQALEEELALSDVKFNQARSTTSSRGRSRVFTRDAFAVREIGETNAQAITASGKNRARALGLSALGQGLSTTASALSI